MVNDLSLTSRSSSLADNRLQEFQSSTMTHTFFQKSQSLSVPVPRFIVYRYFTIDSVLDSRPNFNWLPFEGVSSYIVQLSDSNGVFWQKHVDKTNVSYDGDTILRPGNNYLFTVEIADNKNPTNDLVKTESSIADDVRKGIETIQNTSLPRQFKASILAQLDGLLIARAEILDIIRRAILQGSNSEIICFLADFLDRGSAFKLLADDCVSDNILDVLAEIASQLAAAHIILAKYLYLSAVQQSLAESLLSKGTDLSVFAQNLEGAFQLGQFSRSIRLGGCPQSCKNDLANVCQRSECRDCDCCKGG